MANKNVKEVEIRALDKVTNVLADIKKAFESLNNIKVKLDTKGLAGQLDDIKRKINSVLSEKKVKVTVNKTDLNKSVTEANAIIRQKLLAKREIPVTIKTDYKETGKGTTKVTKGVKQEKLEEKPKAKKDNTAPKIKIQVDTSQANRAIRSISDQLNKLKNIEVNLKVNNAKIPKLLDAAYDGKISQNRRSREPEPLDSMYNLRGRLIGQMNENYRDNEGKITSRFQSLRNRLTIVNSAIQDAQRHAGISSIDDEMKAVSKMLQNYSNIHPLGQALSDHYRQLAELKQAHQTRLTDLNPVAKDAQRVMVDTERFKIQARMEALERKNQELQAKIVEMNARFQRQVESAGNRADAKGTRQQDYYNNTWTKLRAQEAKELDALQKQANSKLFRKAGYTEGELLDANFQKLMNSVDSKANVIRAKKAELDRLANSLATSKYSNAVDTRANLGRKLSENPNDNKLRREYIRSVVEAGRQAKETGNVNKELTNLGKIIAQTDKSDPMRDILVRQHGRLSAYKDNLSAELKNANPNVIRNREEKAYKALEKLANNREFSKVGMSQAYLLDDTFKRLLADSDNKLAVIKQKHQALKDLLRQVEEDNRRVAAHNAQYGFTESVNKLGRKSSDDRRRVIQEENDTRKAIANQVPTSPAAARNNPYQTLQAEANKYAKQAEMIWRNAGNKTSDEFDRIANKYRATIQKMIDAKRDLGALSFNQEANLLKRQIRNIPTDTPLYDKMLVRIKELKRAQAELNAKIKEGQEAKPNPRKPNPNDLGYKNPKRNSILDYFKDSSGLANVFSYITRFLGRSSKGIGSAGEATAGAISGLARFGTVAAGVAAAVGVIVAAAAAVGTAFTLVSDAAGRLTGIFMQVYNTLMRVLEPGIKLYNDTEKAEMAITAGIMSNSKIDGRAPTQEEAQSISKQLIQRSIRDAMTSVFDPMELINAMQGTMAMALNKGLNAQQAYEVTKGVASVAKLTRLGPNQVLQETRDLMQGTITARNSQVANSLGITNEDLEQFKGDADAIFKFLTEKFKHYTEILKEYANTPIGAFENLKETIAVTGMAIVKDLVEPLVTVMKDISKWMGAFRDKENHRVDEMNNLIDDDGDFIDKNGRKLGKNEKPVQATTEVDFIPNETLQRFKDSLFEIMKYIAKAIDDVTAFMGIPETNMDAIDKFTWAMKLLIDAIVICAKALYTIVEVMIELGKAAVKVWDFCVALVEIFISFGEILLTFQPQLWILIYAFAFLGAQLIDTIHLTAIGIKVLALFGKAIASVSKAIMAFLFSLPKGLDAAKAAFSKEIDNFGENKRNKELYNEVTNDLEYFDKNNLTKQLVEGKSLEEMLGIKGLGNKHGQGIGAQAELDKGIVEYRKRLAEKAAKQKNVDPSKAQGTAKPDKKADKEKEKADKKAIQEAQKMLRDHREALKGVLQDKLDQLKAIMEQNETAYKSGFETIQQYFKNKTELEKQEAQERLTEAQEELVAIQNSKFENDYEKLKELHKVQREITKYQRQLDKTIHVQKTVADQIGQFSGVVSDLTNSFQQALYSQSTALTPTGAYGNSGAGFDASGNAISGENQAKLKAILAKKAAEMINPNNKMLPYLLFGQMTAEMAKPNPDGTVNRNLYDDHNYSGMSGTASTNPDGHYRHPRPENEGGYYRWYNTDQDFLNDWTSTLKEGYDILNSQTAQDFVEGLKYRGKWGSYFESDDVAGYINNVASGVKAAMETSELNSILSNQTQAIQDNTAALQGNTQAYSGRPQEIPQENNFHGIDTRYVDMNNPLRSGQALIDDVEGVNPIVRQGINMFAKRVFEETGKYMSWNIGSAGHEDDTSPYGHKKGYKLDVDINIPRAVMEKIGKELGVAVADEGNHYDMSFAYGHTYQQNILTGFDTGEQFWEKMTKGGGMSLAGGGMSAAGGNSGYMQMNTVPKYSEELDAFNKLQEALDKYADVMSEVESNIFGLLPRLDVKLRSLIKEKLELERGAAANPNDELIAKKLNAVKIRISQEIDKVMVEAISKQLDFNMQRIETTSKYVANRIAYGAKDYYDTDFDKMYNKYMSYITVPIPVDELKEEIRRTTQILARYKDATAESIDSFADTYKKINDDFYTYKVTDNHEETYNKYAEMKKQLDEMKESLSNMAKDGKNDTDEFKQLYEKRMELNNELYKFMNTDNTKEIIDKYNDYSSKLNRLRSERKKINKYNKMAKAKIDYSEWKKANDYEWQITNTEGTSPEDIAAAHKKTQELLEKYNKSKPEGDREYRELELALSNMQTQLNLAKQTPANQIKALEDLLVEATKKGNVEQAEQIKQKMYQLHNKIFDIAKSWIDSITKRFDSMKSVFDAYNLPNFVQERGDRELEIYKNQSLHAAYTGQMKSESAKYIELQRNLSELQAQKDKYESEYKTIPADTTNQGQIDRAIKLKDLIADINIRIASRNEELDNLKVLLDDLQQNIDLTEQLSKNIDLMRDFGKVAKESIQDNFVTFLTDGVQEAESLGDALRNFVMSVLKDMNKFFAERLSKALWQHIFGYDESFNTGGGNSIELGRQAKPQATYQVKELSSSIDDLNKTNESMLNVFADKGGVTSSMQRIESQGSYRDMGLGYGGLTLAQMNKLGLDNNGLFRDKNGKLDTSKMAIANPFGGVDIYRGKDSTLKFMNEKRGLISDETKQLYSTNIPADSSIKDTMDKAMNITNGTVNITNATVQGLDGVNMPTNPNDKAPEYDNRPYSEMTKDLDEASAAQAAIDAAKEAAESSSQAAESSSKAAESASQATQNATERSYDKDVQSTATLTGTSKEEVQQEVNKWSSQVGTEMGTSVGTAVSPLEQSLQALGVDVRQLSTTIQTAAGAGSAAPSSKAWTGGIATARGIVKSFARGGMVRGAGTSTSDSIPAMLSNGEAVINAKAVKKLGTRFVHSINRGDFTKIHAMIPHFATGGIVGDVNEETSRGMTSFAKNIGTSVSTTNNMNIALVRDEQEAMRAFMGKEGQRYFVDFARKSAHLTSRF